MSVEARRIIIVDIQTEETWYIRVPTEIKDMMTNRRPMPPSMPVTSAKGVIV
jgi:hypothetical protein